MGSNAHIYLRELLELLVEKITQLEEGQQATNTRLDRLENKVDTLAFKHDITHRKLDDLSLDIKIAERDTRRDISRLKDSTETLVVVLEDKGILHKAQ